ncbi:MAG TPA: hypothetical protein VMZ33_01510 [Candidatus Limnocylindrales bacterium]|nr:hypothetical protein [Candidatus Limnocylindrales bacterium]
MLTVGASMALAGNAMREGPGSPTQPPGVQTPGAATLIQPAPDITQDASVDITGTLPPNLARIGESTLRVFVNGDQVRERDLPAEQQFVLDDVPLVEGHNEITVGLTVDGHSGAQSAPVSITSDSTAPEIQILRPEPGTIAYAGRETMRGRTEAGASIEIYARGSEQELPVSIGGDGRFEAVIVLAMGDNDFTLRSIDLAGNPTTVHHVITRQVTLASITLNSSIEEVALAGLPAAVDLTANVRDEHGGKLEGVDVVFSLSPPTRATTTYRATTRNGVARWSNVSIPDSPTSVGTWLATVLVILPSGEELREDVAFVVH